jgi:hypothetical protein
LSHWIHVMSAERIHADDTTVPCAGENEDCARPDLDLCPR